MDEETLSTVFPPDSSDLDFSFTSTTSTSSSFTNGTFTSTSSSARSSLSLPSFSSSTSLLTPPPHRRSDPRWSAIRAASSLSLDSSLHLRHLHLLRHLGSGHLARVFLCRLKGFDDSLDFALKVIDLDALDPSSNLLSHVRTEARVLSSLDHPFLPTLYARLDASHYACFLIDYCPGGDLHSLLLKSPSHRLPLPAVRFIAAEVLLALEYLHSLGFVYRDLKPENVLIRSDGHIMLSDFDLCFHSDVSPALLQHHNSHRPPPKTTSTCSCFPQKAAADRPELDVGEIEFVAEPKAAFSIACVGTHEYLAPEVVAGSGHGNGVDWWAFGVFVYELMYGRTPFKGSSKEETLRNIAKSSPDQLRFADVGDDASASATALADLVRSLLVRDPRDRLGSSRGAAEIKRHPFFADVRWALIRNSQSPVVVGPNGAVLARGSSEGKGSWWRKLKTMVCRKNKGVRVGLGSKEKRTKDCVGKSK